jgi:glycosyltransferase involved in cell wall biosynthesis
VFLTELENTSFLKRESLKLNMNKNQKEGFLPKISLIIPAYNEEQRIGKTLDNYSKKFGKEYGENFEILVVLNGCRDSTLNVVKKQAQKNSLIKFFNIKEAVGKGGAIRAGLSEVSGDLVGYTDADGSTSPEMMIKLFKVLNIEAEIDCVVGSRNMEQSVVKGKKVSRMFISTVFNTFVNLLFNFGLKDTQCGAKVFSKEINDGLKDRLSVSNMAFDVDLLLNIKFLEGNIMEVPINWEDDEGTTINNPLKTSLLMFFSVWRLRLFYSPLRFFYNLLRPLDLIFWSFLGGRKNDILDLK